MLVTRIGHISAEARKPDISLELESLSKAETARFFTESKSYLIETEAM